MSYLCFTGFFWCGHHVFYSTRFLFPRGQYFSNCFEVFCSQLFFNMNYSLLFHHPGFTHITSYYLQNLFIHQISEKQCFPRTTETLRVVLPIGKRKVFFRHIWVAIVQYRMLDEMGLSLIQGCWLGNSGVWSPHILKVVEGWTSQVYSTHTSIQHWPRRTCLCSPIFLVTLLGAPSSQVISTEFIPRM